MEDQVERVCPWWMGYLLLFPLRKLGQNPYKILSPYIKKGMNLMDYGSAMGYFSLPMAKMTGNTGAVYCMDIQEKMLESLQRRAKKRGVDHIIMPRLISDDYNFNELQEKIDFILLFAVVHEVPDKEELFKNLHYCLKTGGRVLFSEPKGHVSLENFNSSLKIAQRAGFKITDETPVPNGLGKILKK
jgi:2-polyprenyl-3-methyl-5-hydroxy-6-metoxy-1,4-benzoquinol methylase